MSGAERLKQVACAAIDAAQEQLGDVSREIWCKPELAFKEKHAHKILTDFLDEHGFQTERSYKLETAFKATYGSRADGPNVSFISEYDALPEIGHACGHNLIAEVGVGAGLGLMAAMKVAGKPLGQVTVLGTPAEEGPGGKIHLIEAGAFTDVDVAMMAHPFPDNDFRPVALARLSLDVVYTGRASHAAGYPWEGVNDLDAAVTCYQGISCLRQQCKPDWRVHCIILEGGVKVNIIPERARLHVGVRAPSDEEMFMLKDKVMNIITSAATSTGCQVEHKLMSKPYSSMLSNEVMVGLFEKNVSRVQPPEVPTRPGSVFGSTDMGNVAHVVPSIHPNFHIGGRAVNHTRDFTGDAGSPMAQEYTLQIMKALAMTAIDILTDQERLQEIKQAFAKSMSVFN
ncbi:peptidase M20 domain-containing protein 2-like [Mya arenaria]|uniref:peptidase M20 domain-containing protein 2-like n=1 Tax=Mya arenaria TaxID=6604 RepID=UPI0022E211AC|nr:peptidase M20 domain-containing protein 2-like [Mya arenaria]